MKALESVSFSVEGGRMLFVLGPNGSGKTTLLRILAGALVPREGKIFVDGRELAGIPRRERGRLIGYVPQISNSSELTVYDAVLLGRKPYFEWGEGEKDRRIVDNVIKLLRLEGLAARRLSELSGGELQRVVIARALAQEPKILLLDEPTNNLDIRSQAEIMEIIRETISERNVIAVLSTHDVNLALLYADEILLLKKGRVVLKDSPESIGEKEIREVYGIDVKIYQVDGKRFVYPYYK